LFNLIPNGPFDGAKVLAWSSSVYVAMLAVAGVMAFGLARHDTLITVWSWMVSLIIR